MCAKRFQAGPVRELQKVCAFAPVSMIARAAGVSRSRINALVDHGWVRWELVYGYGLIEVASVLRFYEGSVKVDTRCGDLGGGKK